MRYQRNAILGLCAAIVLAGCTRVVVTKDPGYDDEGVRFYRPKPYLWVVPAGAAAEDGSSNGDDNKSNDERSEGDGGEKSYVSISIKYLPDYNEEYSIRLNSGLGSGELNIDLDDGWNLTHVGQITDQQVDELIGSIASLATPILGKVRTTSHSKSKVPVGLYEAVIAIDPATCRKRLFGWRYVGFAPICGCEICPVDNVYPVTCEQLYKLAFDEHGDLVFEQMNCSDQMAQSQTQF